MISIFGDSDSWFSKEIEGWGKQKVVVSLDALTENKDGGGESIIYPKVSSSSLLDFVYRSAFAASRLGLPFKERLKKYLCLYSLKYLDLEIKRSDK